MKTKASIFSLLFSLILGACAPTGTPLAGPDISGKVIAKTVTIVSASASPASFAYSYECGTTFIPPFDITFTVSFDDPLDRPLTSMVVDIHFAYSAPGYATSTGNFILEIVGRTGTIDTYSGNLVDNAPKFYPGLAGAYAGKPGVFTWSATVEDESSTELAKTDVFEIPFAACTAPLVVPTAATIVLPHIDLTIVPPGSGGTHEPGGGGSPPSCSVEPNNPNCKP